MKSLFLDDRTVRDIEQRVAHLHADIDHRGGRVKLVDVRQLLRIDLKFYTLDEPGLLDHVVHKLTIGARQVIARPTLLFEAARKFDLKALFVPDRKQILIDAAVPDLKKRWNEGHEIVHSVLPWHADYLLGDNRATLLPSCHERIEAEANYGAGKLLFPSTEFAGLCRDSALNIANIKAIASHFGNTITSTLWRCVENSDRVCFGLIGEHPRYPREDRAAVEHFVQSRSFAQRFGHVDESAVLTLIKSYCSYRRGGGPLGAGEVVVTDGNGEAHVFAAETFGTGHNVLTFAHIVRAAVPQVVVPVGLAGTP